VRDQRLRLDILPAHSTGIQAVRGGSRAGNESAVKIEVCSETATALSACAKGGGKVLPRFSARRRMPRQARGVNQYRCGSSPVSKMSDNEDATPSLGYSKMLRWDEKAGLEAGCCTLPFRSTH
jgi:hypothetical protein